MSNQEMSERGLVVKGLRKSYKGGVSALNGVDLEVTPGLYGLLGPNGAGKSTLMRTLASLQQPDSGSITLDGIDALADPDSLRFKLGYLPQQIGAYPNVSGRDLLERFAWLKGRTDKKIRKQEVEYLLTRVNLERDAHRAVATYSGGMLRRFGIAVALIGKPRLLIVDEPTAGLDPAERSRFHRILAEIGSDAVVLLSTHIVEDIENLCTRLSIMAKGRIVAAGTPDSLKGNLKGQIWQREVPRDQTIPDDALHATATPYGTRVVISGIAQQGYSERTPRLEDVYYHALRAAQVEEV
ncbi:MULTISPECIES: ABC transporter ATP-binding protein [unclassified Pseudoalteromonas]|uniref:ABC transporter ATP-binding protein n=1 Tax=unclassified Pseudoalteromonas TaxID=194690 RepID=UPI0025B5E91C|nr:MULTISPECIES: ABC transporter ATP-binding protein [unclassified Pseudoalteromonas]MDN3379502.1 ABC transporter ATP-binding protein [Pseudoalteromonas sp. APC 3893]MDN3387842.1 ABC transporter ATP-binding protein [Pseudoalteromonas sp. APC 4017]